MSNHCQAWTRQEEQFVRDNVKTMNDTQMAKALNRTVDAVKGFRFRRGILTGRTGYFKKGHHSWNTGKNPKDYMSQESYEAIQKTQFQKGNEPANTKWDGAISVRADKSGHKYLYIRIKKAKWVLYHRYLWEKKNGKIPKGKILAFRDGNSMNVSPENMELITCAENARRNSNWEKAMQTMKKNKNHPSRDLTDNYIIGQIARGDEDVREYLENNPDLINVIRANYKLKRQINEESR